MTGSNYGQAEDVITNMFNQMTSSLGKGGGSDTSPDPHRAVDGPVSENTPTMPLTGRVSPLGPSAPAKSWDVSPPPNDPGLVDGPPPAPNPYDFSPPPPPPPPRAKVPGARPLDPDHGMWGLG